MQALTRLSPYRRFIATAAAVLGALFLYQAFPIDDRLNPTFQSVLLGALFFVALPVLFVRIILKERLQAIGLMRSERRLAWLSVPLVAIPTLAILYLITRIYPVAEGYYIPTLAAGSFPVFLLYEVVLVGAIAFLYEVFFRGFVQLVWLGRYGITAAFIQAAIFFGFVLFSDDVTWQSVPVTLAALASGFVVFYTRSIWYSWATAWLVLFLADVYFLAR